jgi:hypothetical protein
MSEQQAEQGAVGVVDTWTRFVQQELPAEIDRLRKKPMGIEQLQVEVHSTVLHAVHQLGDMLIKMRDDVYDRLAEHDVELETLDERLDDVDPSEDETRLLPEDAQAIGKLAAAAKLFAEEALKATHGETAIAKLQEIVTIADYCAELASEKVVELEADELDDAQDDAVVVDGVAEVR